MPAGEPRRLEPTGTVLITGGAGELGRELARHLVDRHGVRHLLLTSRRGLETPGAPELVAALQALGAETVQVVSCDVSDRDSVRSVLSSIPAERRLTGVFHLAGVLDDGIVPALTGERLERVLRPKLDGAYHLHELTAEQDLAAFVLFSSVAGLGGAGQANYAAASVFLDALAAERRHRGLAGLSLMWGFWEPRGAGMTAHLGRAELMRMRRQGVLPLSLELGLELLDAALSRPEAVLIPLRLDVGVMQRQLGGAEVPALYRALLRGGLKRASAASGDTSALRARLAALASEAERLKALVELAQEDIAAVLALPGASSVPADVPLKELGSGFVDGGGAAQPAVGAGGDQAADDAGLRLSDAEGDGAAAVGEAGAGSGSCSGGAKARRRCSDGGVGSHRDRGDELPCAERSDEPGELLGAAGERGRGRGPAAERAGAVSCCGDWRWPRGAWREKAVSSMRWRNLTRGSLASRRGRRSRWTRSSG